MIILDKRQASKIIIASIVVVALTAITTSASPIEDYVLRDKVNEALVQSADVRRGIVNYYQENKRLPQSSADIDKAAPIVLASGDEVVVNERGFILYLRSEELELSGKSVEFHLFQGETKMEWDCTGGSLADKLRPSICRGIKK